MILHTSGHLLAALSVKERERKREKKNGWFTGCWWYNLRRVLELWGSCALNLMVFSPREIDFILCSLNFQWQCQSPRCLSAIRPHGSRLFAVALMKIHPSVNIERWNAYGVPLKWNCKWKSLKFLSFLLLFSFVADDVQTQLPFPRKKSFCTNKSPRSIIQNEKICVLWIFVNNYWQNEVDH